MFEYFNLIYWIIAFASLIAFARFATFVSDDVTHNLVDQPELPWKVGYAVILLVLALVFLLAPFPWNFVINLVIAGSAVGAYWAIRVKTLGPEGHLFKKTLQNVAQASNKMEERRSARQVQLTY